MTVGDCECQSVLRSLWDGLAIRPTNRDGLPRIGNPRTNWDGLAIRPTVRLLQRWDLQNSKWFEP